MTTAGRTLACWLVAGAFGACGGPVGSTPPNAQESNAAISGGQSDPADSAVVGVVDLLGDMTADFCSGTLIAPNAVLTARHCVSDTLDQQMDRVDCARTHFGPPHPVAHFLVTTNSTFPTHRAGYFAVREVFVAPGGDLLCGFDEAILILDASVGADVAAPLVPRLSPPPQAKETYSAVGFGQTSEADGGTDDSGSRRRRDGLVVMCDGSACGGGNVKDDEWVGDQGICRGDSGGPAVDNAGRIIGVASRGGDGCASPVYGDVSSHADFLRGVVARAAQLAGQPPPAWAAGATPVGPPSESTPTAPGNSLAPKSGGGGCNAVPGKSSAGVNLAALLLSLAGVVVVLIVRRRRAETGA